MFTSTVAAVYLVFLSKAGLSYVPFGNHKACEDARVAIASLDEYGDVRTQKEHLKIFKEKGLKDFMKGQNRRYSLMICVEGK